MNKIDLVGQKFNLLTVVKQHEQKSKSGKILWQCKCDCGNNTIVFSDSLKTGNTKSCGCLNLKLVKERATKHNNDGNYELLNCRWATPKQQANNKTNNVIVEYNGETMNITEWCERLNIKRDLYYRKAKKMSATDIFKQFSK